MKKEKVNRVCGVVFPVYCLELVDFGFWNTRNSYLSVNFLLRVEEKRTEYCDFVYQNTILI